MDRFEEIVNLKLDHLTELMGGVVERIEDHEERIRVIERWKYKLAAAGTGIAAAVGAAGHKIGDWLGFTQQ